MSREEDFCDRLIEMVEAARSGNLHRREFLRRATLLGLSTAAAGTLMNSVFAREALARAPAAAPSPSPVPPSRRDAALQQISVAGSSGHYKWGTKQPAHVGKKVSKEVFFTLRSPHEGSPRILTKGWKMTADVEVKIRGVGPEIRSKIRWSGSGAFSNAVGQQSTPSFSKAGWNSVKLSVQINRTEYVSTFRFYAKDANLYARLGSKAKCSDHGHGCPACPHTVIGPVITGAPDFLLDGKPVARVGDDGIHAACCGPNIYKVSAGDPEIVINGKHVARIGDATKHCFMTTGKLHSIS